MPVLKQLQSISNQPRDPASSIPIAFQAVSCSPRKWSWRFSLDRGRLSVTFETNKQTRYCTAYPFRNPQRGAVEMPQGMPGRCHPPASQNPKRHRGRRCSPTGSGHTTLHANE